MGCVGSRRRKRAAVAGACARNTEILSKVQTAFEDACAVREAGAYVSLGLYRLAFSTWLLLDYETRTGRSPDADRGYMVRGLVNDYTYAMPGLSMGGEQEAVLVGLRLERFPTVALVLGHRLQNPGVRTRRGSS